MYEKLEGSEQRDTLPIPTYDEAINSRPSSSQSFLGAQEVSHDAERQGLLGARDGEGNSGYHPPTAESVRDSLDSLASSVPTSLAGSTEDLRREIQQMDMEDPFVDTNRMGLLANGRLSKRFNSLTHSLSSIHLPFRQWLPSWDYLKAKIESFPFSQLAINWILIIRLLALLGVVSLIYVLFISNIFRMNRGRGRVPADPELLRAYVRDNVKESSIRDYLTYVSSFDHMAGTRGGLVQAEFIESRFGQSHFDDVGLEKFEVYLNFPKEGGRRVAIIEPAGLAWEASLEEEFTYFDDRSQVPAFHGYSKSGNVTGHLIYANYGSQADFDRLTEHSVQLTNSVILIRSGGSEKDGSAIDLANKVYRAAQHGAVGCLTYSDPTDNGRQSDLAYPDGPALPVDGVQRGSVGLTNKVLGDPLTPGWPSLPDENRRQPLDGNTGLNQIPSIPLAWRDAKKLFQILKGHGKHLDQSGGDAAAPEDDWWTGDENSPVVHLRNEQDDVERSPIYNVLGQIIGVEQPDQSIIVGNHYDAWCFGAGDPGSGTAIFLEVVRIFGELRELGWRPLRTIEFAAWDAGAYNMIGSTEHVEARSQELYQKGAAYLNVEAGALGPKFAAAASPVLQTALLQVLERVIDPSTNDSMRTAFAERHTLVGGLGAGSDYAAFQHLVGVSSLDMSFQGQVSPSHSCYDNIDWMLRYGDPDFPYHKTMAQILALLILDLSDREILPFDFEAYANGFAGYVHGLETLVSSMDQTLDTSSLNNAVTIFLRNAKVFRQWSQEWANVVYGAGGGIESTTLAIQRMSHNVRMSNFEHNLLIPDGLPGRQQYKHVLFGPSGINPHEFEAFPSVRDAIRAGDWERAQQEVERVSQMVTYAAQKLNN